MPPRPPISLEKRKERYLEAVRDKMVSCMPMEKLSPLPVSSSGMRSQGFLKRAKC